MIKRYAIVGAKIFDGNHLIKGKALVINSNLIEGFIDVSEVLNLETIDMSDKVLAPAFIDLQINGCGGVLFNDDISLKTLEIMHATNLKFGTTSFLPTLITTSEDEIKSAVKVATAFHEKNPYSCIGIHIEGPYISKIKKGIHNPIYMKDIPEEMVDFLIESSSKIPIKITMAPEENSLDLIKKLTVGGVKVSIGHSNATYSVARNGIDNGISFATHLFNAMSPMEGRAPGVVGAVLSSHDVYAGIIVDGYHVDYNIISLVKEIKKDKLFIVTDAVTPMGTDMESFRFADQLIYVKEGKCVNESGTLAGANIDMMCSVKNAVESVGISLQESLRMASLYPAKAMGIDGFLGRIKKGYIANLVAFDSNYRISLTIDGGKVIKN